jgi:hypothetical protein
MTPYPYPALVLWLIREGIASTWYALAEYFDIEANSRVRFTLHRSLIDLHEAGLTAIKGSETAKHELQSLDELHDDLTFSVTTFSHEILRILDLSLLQLSRSEPNSRMILNPAFSRTTGTQYKSDILVFMPFTDVLRPVYDDHLKAVAANLGQTIKRGDDFFTTKQVIGDIWTALLETKLVIADCTGRNPNVFYEIGLAHVVGKPTILITQNRDDVPFDLRHLRYIEYELTPRGMKRFEKELEQTIKYS